MSRPDPIRVPLSPFQATRLATIKAELDALAQRTTDLAARHSEGVTIAISAVTDTGTVQGWDIQVIGSEIVCTPPPEPAQA